MNLSTLKPGESARITKVGGEGALRQHFLDMGVIPGASVTVIKLAPLGDPMELRIHGYELTLRVADAEQIGVEPLEGGDSPQNPSKKRQKTEHPGLGEEGRFHPKGTGVKFQGVFAAVNRKINRLRTDFRKNNNAAVYFQFRRGEVYDITRCILGCNQSVVTAVETTITLRPKILTKVRAVTETQTRRHHVSKSIHLVAEPLAEWNIKSIQLCVERHAHIIIIYIIETKNCISLYSLPLLIPFLIYLLHIHAIGKIKRGCKINILKQLKTCRNRHLMLHSIAPILNQITFK